MNAARWLAATLLVGCGTPRPNGALLAGDEIAIVVSSSVSPELESRQVGPSDPADTTRDFTAACASAMAEAIIAEPLIIVIVVAAPPVLLACPVGGLLADTAVALARQRPASDDVVLSQAIAGEIAERDFEVRFRDALDTQLATHFRVVSGRAQARAVIHARLSAIEVAEYDDRSVSLRIDGSTRVERSGRRGPVRWNRILIETPRRSYEEWTESDGELLMADVDAGIVELADEVALAAMKDPRTH